MDILQFAVLAVSLTAGLGIGYFLKKEKFKKEESFSKEEAKKILSEAEIKARDVLMNANNEAFRIINELKSEEEKKRGHWDVFEARLMTKEEALEKKLSQTEERKAELESKIESAMKLREEAEALKEMQKAELEKIAGLSRYEAKELLIKEVELSARKDIAEQIKRAEQELKKESSEKAKMILADAVQKYAAEVATENTITVVSLPSDDMKGRIIGKEGRNVIAFEQATGVDVIIDDTPGSIVISGFDLIRRHIAKVSLEKLIYDGRIHPARIEEVVKKSKEEVEVMIKELGEKAAYETGVAGLHPDIIKLLGRLKFKTFRGQNLLKHSMEISFLASGLASSLGADVNVCKKAGLLSQIGKAVGHEIPGHFAIIGRDILKKYNIPQNVVHCVEANCDTIEPKSLEAMLVQSADLVAKSRPGAQKDNLESYIKRLNELEDVSKSFDGVEEAYALQAGSEVRVFVKPDVIDDYAATKLTYEIARKIEKDLQFPGQIKILVVRELRAESVAK